MAPPSKKPRSVLNPILFNNSSRNTSSEQREYLISFMEKHTDFAKGRVKAMQGRAIFDKIWMRLAAKLNELPGARRDAKQWKKVWSDLRSYAKKIALSNGRVKNNKTGGGYFSSDEEDHDEAGSGGIDFAYTTDNIDVDRIMEIIGWASAFGTGVEDELSFDDDTSADKENDAGLLNAGNSSRTIPRRSAGSSSRSSPSLSPMLASSSTPFGSTAAGLPRNLRPATSTSSLPLPSPPHHSSPTTSIIHADIKDIKIDIAKLNEEVKKISVMLANNLVTVDVLHVNETSADKDKEEDKEVQVQDVEAPDVQEVDLDSLFPIDFDTESLGDI